MTNRSIPPLHEGEATLRALTLEDLPHTLAWRNHPDSRVWFHSTETIAPQQHVDWFEKYLLRDDDYVFVVDVAGEPRAQAALYHLTAEGAEFGRLLVDPSSRGLGLAHLTIRLCLRAAREVFGMPRLTLEVKHDNLAARRAYERAGFVEVRRDADGVVQMELLLN
ncbi:MAG: GNAT family N-acetyltransferase [Rhodoglobus sp.]